MASGLVEFGQTNAGSLIGGAFYDGRPAGAMGGVGK
jgi:hypothetical protein